MVRSDSSQVCGCSDPTCLVTKQLTYLPCLQLEAALDKGMERFERSADQWTQGAARHWDHQIAEVIKEFQTGRTLTFGL